MNNQDKIEKVIKGLECCTQHGSMGGRNCNGHWGYTDASHSRMELIGEYRAGCTYGNCETGCVKTLAKDALALLKAQKPITGETSDGYHTFNELYHHRAVLFSVIVNNYKDLAWKSVRHHDGTMYDGMFIVGIDTPVGQATYHYDINPYWDMFKCRVREFAPEWDGHTPAQAIERIGKLKAREPMTPVTSEAQYGDHLQHCPSCGVALPNSGEYGKSNYCYKCGQAVKWK